MKSQDLKLIEELYSPFCFLLGFKSVKSLEMGECAGNLKDPSQPPPFSMASKL